jgi:hypothetical protein
MGFYQEPEPDRIVNIQISFPLSRGVRLLLVSAALLVMGLTGLSVYTAYQCYVERARMDQVDVLIMIPGGGDETEEPATTEQPSEYQVI